MAYAFVQQVENSLASSAASTTSPSITCTAHNTVVVVASQNPGSIATLTDTIGNTYLALGNTNFFSFGLFLYVCQDTLGGANVLTSHTNGTDSNGIAVSEWSGLVTSGGVIGQSFNGVNGPGSGPDAISSGNIVVGTTPAALISFCWDVIAGTFIPVTGTGFTGRTPVWAAINGNAQALFEDKRLISPATYAGTWSADPGNQGDAFPLLAVAIAELAGTALMGQICT